MSTLSVPSQSDPLPSPYAQYTPSLHMRPVHAPPACLNSSDAHSAGPARRSKYGAAPMSDVREALHQRCVIHHPLTARGQQSLMSCSLCLEIPLPARHSNCWECQRGKERKVAASFLLPVPQLLPLLKALGFNSQRGWPDGWVGGRLVNALASVL